MATEKLDTSSESKAQVSKRVTYLAEDFRNGGIVEVYRSFERGAKRLGWQVRVVDGRGDRAELRRLAAQALDNAPDGVVLGGIQPEVLAASIAQFKARDIQVVGWHAGDRPGPSDLLFSNVTTDPLLVADMAAAYVVRDGRVGVVIFTDSRFAIATTKAQRMAEQIRKCGDCRVLSLEDLPISHTAEGMVDRVASLQKRFGREWTHTLAINDLYFDHINGPLNTAGRKNIRNISAGDGSPKALGRIYSGLSLQVATVAEPLDAQGLQLVDELSRAFAGEPASDYVSQPLLITKELMHTAESLGIDLLQSPENGHMLER